MRKFIILLFLVCALKTNAQTITKIDSIYYFLDTLKTPKNDRMWKIVEEDPLKFYKLLCPCLDYQNYPSFVYRMDNKGEIMKKEKVKDIKFISLPGLILKAKASKKKQSSTHTVFFFVEPHGKDFIKHKIGLMDARDLSPTDG